LGYALRHLSDLRRGFSEFHRVLRPGGRLCILEITVPENPFWRALLRGYLRGLGPLLCRLAGQHRRSPILWKYYWDTIETCVAPQAVLAALDEAGFKDVKRGVAQGIFSEYTGRK
jgi:demethylmenaquinone methyltransferase/2-methoxy-6-polyprenyl-1,4-benzoquinol methylase